VWAGRTTGNATKRLMAYNEIADEKYGRDQRNLSGERLGCENGYVHPGVTKHFTFSPPQEWAIEKMQTVSGVRSLKRECYRMLEIAGIDGAGVVFHHLRHTRLAKEEFRSARSQGMAFTGKGIWHWLNRNGFLQNDEYVYVSPHFHVVGKGYAMKSNEFHEVTRKRNRDGWIYKNIRELYDEKAIGEVMYYVLSHATVVSGGNLSRSLDCVNYYGSISKTRMGKSLDNKEYFDCSCPKCENSVCECVGWDQELSYDPDVREEVWKLKKNDPDSNIPFRATNQIMQYRIEKWRYFLKENPRWFSVQVHGREPDLREKGPPREMVNYYETHAYDWVSGQWFDMNGEVVE